MANISLEDLLNVVNVLNNSGSNNEEPKKNEEEQTTSKVKTEEEIRAEVIAEIEAEKNKENDPEEKNEDSEEDSLAARENKHIARTVSTELKSSGVDDSSVEEILAFVDYGTLKSEEGEADDEKIASFVDLLSSVAKRVPPKGARKRNIDDDGGLSKYLQDK